MKANEVLSQTVHNDKPSCKEKIYLNAIKALRSYYDSPEWQELIVGKTIDVMCKTPGFETLDIHEKTYALWVQARQFSESLDIKMVSEVLNERDNV